MSDSVASKRRFLMRAFAPVGAQVCEAVGMTPTSPDVAAAEQEEAVCDQRLVAAVALEDISRRVHWYVEARESSHNCREVNSRGLADDLMSFTLSLFSPVVMEESDE